MKIGIVCAVDLASKMLHCKTNVNASSFQHPKAARLCPRPAHSYGRDLDTAARASSDRAASHSQASTSAGSPPAKAAPSLLKIPPHILAAGGLDPATQGPEGKASFANLLSSLFLSVNLDFPGLRVINVDPPVLTVANFLSEQQCDELIAAAQQSGRMIQSAVGGYNVEGQSDIRTSSTLAVTSEVMRQEPALQQCLLQLLDRARQLLPDAPTAGSSGSSFAKPSGPGQFAFELPQVACYRQGQQFKTHEDAFPVELARAKGYQRRATLLVYLNDVAQGGATKFDILDITVQPKKGQALLFFPAFKPGVNDKRTLHTAQPAVDEKFITQLWLSAGLPAPPAANGRPAAAAAIPGMPMHLQRASSSRQGGGNSRKGGKRK